MIPTLLKLKLPVDYPISKNGEFGASRPTDEDPGRKHMGIDYAALRGTSVRASEGGRVVRASNHPTKVREVIKDGKKKKVFIGSYGKVIIIDHAPYSKNFKASNKPERHIYTLYAHLEKMKVKLGDMVYTGQVSVPRDIK